MSSHFYKNRNLFGYLLAHTDCLLKDSTHETCWKPTRTKKTMLLAMIKTSVKAYRHAHQTSRRVVKISQKKTLIGMRARDTAVLGMYLFVRQRRCVCGHVSVCTAATSWMCACVGVYGSGLRENVFLFLKAQ